MNLLLLNCVVFSVVLTILFKDVTSQTVYCETIENYDYGLGYGSLKICFMKGTTSIDSDEFVISPADSSVDAISFYTNNKIRFLPTRVDESYPNLVGYFASTCSIKTVLKKNLKNLKKLKRLDLSGNQIERINRDTFEFLTSLERLDLNNNKIKEINGAAFGGSKRLATVWLQNNDCIDRDYFTPTAIANLIREVTEKCGFPEVEETMENISRKTLETQNNN